MTASLTDRAEPDPADPPGRVPTVVTATFPCGQQLSTIAQMLLASVELSLWHDVVEVIGVRRVVHEVACHLERLAAADADLTVRIAASPARLEVDLSVMIHPGAHAPDQWILEMAAECFDEVATRHDGDRLTVRLAATPRDGGGLLHTLG